MYEVVLPAVADDHRRPQLKVELKPERGHDANDDLEGRIGTPDFDRRDVGTGDSHLARKRLLAHAEGKPAITAGSGERHAGRDPNPLIVRHGDM
jgi:hypothetical protein